jgi:hypothetical protein
VSPAELAAMMLEASAANRKMNRAAQRSESEERQRDQAEEIGKIRDQASNALVGGLVSGGIQVGSAAMKLNGALDNSSAQQLGDNAEALKVDQQAAEATEGMTDKLSPQDYASQISDLKLAQQGFAQSGAQWTFRGTLADAGNSVAQGFTQANAKELEGAQKDAANRADTAKENRDEAADNVRAQKDLDQAILQAYSALISSQSQLQQSIVSRGA